MESAFDEAGISTTEEAIKHVAECVETAHEMYSESTGEVVADHNLYCSTVSEAERLKKELEKNEKKRFARHAAVRAALQPTLDWLMALSRNAAGAEGLAKLTRAANKKEMV